MSRQGATRLIYASAALVIVCAGIRFAAPVLVPVLLALFIAIVTAPIVIWLCDRGFPRAIAVSAGLLLDMAAGAALGFPLATAVATFTQRLPEYQLALKIRMQGLTEWLAAQGGNIDSIFNFYDPKWLVSFATAMAQTAAGLVSQIVLVLLIVAFMLFEAAGFRQKVSKIATRGQMAVLVEVLREVNTYLVAKTIMSFVTGVVVFLWCWWQGLDVPLLWGLLAYLLNFIPTIGQIIAAVPAIGLALIQLGPGPAAIIALGYAVINVVIGTLEPRIMGQALRLSALVVLLSMVFWGWLLGPVGALLSAPLTMLTRDGLAHSEGLSWIADLLGPSDLQPRPVDTESSPETADTVFKRDATS